MRSFHVIVAAAAAANVAIATQVSSTSELAIREYEEFRQKYRRAGANDQVDYATRLRLFKQRKAEVEAHNAQPGVSWVATLNKFADYTPEEHAAMFGYSRSGRSYNSRSVGVDGGSSFLEVRKKRSVAESIDWSKKLNSSSFIREQGHCGSCWAVASVGALEMHAELRKGQTRKLSYEQLVDCVSNPRHCGGEGGCKGATAELAFDHVAKFGLTAEEEYQGYQSFGDGKCKKAAVHVQSSGFERLPENQVAPLLQAVSEKGPVAVSVDASRWSMYRSGVFDGCGKNATVNHAVLLVGYGVDPQLNKKYWLIRNSWGDGWGEDGYIRLLRHDSDKGDAGYCGTDHDPQQGVGCDGGPPTVPVCGMCGVLSDSSYPKDVEITAS